MRQALLVIVLVGAAFGGGALVSGPGFRWAQEHLLDYMGLKDGGEIDTLELSPAAGAEKSPPDSGPIAGPAAAKPRPGEPTAPPPAPAPKATEPFTEAQAAAAPPAAAPTPASEPAKAEPPALLGALTSMLSPPQAPAPKAKTDPAPIDPSLAPSSLPPLEAAPAAEPSPPPPSGPGGDWAEIRRKLASAGVGRYTIEGEPDGRVVFACLIPLAGKQAVSQRFEADGADEFQAAHAVLKRINLWRASHTPPSAP